MAVRSTLQNIEGACVKLPVPVILRAWHVAAGSALAAKAEWQLSPIADVGVSWEHCRVFLLSVFLLAAAQPNKAPQPTRDLVVIGRLKNLDYELISDPDDLLGHGWITAEMSIERVLRGKAPSRVIQIRYLAHTFRGEGVPLRYRLRRDEDGTYMICVKHGETGVRCR